MSVIYKPYITLSSEELGKLICILKEAEKYDAVQNLLDALEIWRDNIKIYDQCNIVLKKG